GCGALSAGCAAKAMAAVGLARWEQALDQQAGSIVIGECGRVFVLAGKQHKALELLKHYFAQSAVPEYQVARIYDALRNREKALEWLVQAYDARAPEMCFLQIDTLSEALRFDPRFQDLLRRMNFP